MAERRTPSTAIEVDGSKIRELRKDRGIEVADLARTIGCGRPYITKIELGHSPRVSPTVFAAICDALTLNQAERRAIRKTSAPADQLVRQVA